MPTILDIHADVVSTLLHEYGVKDTIIWRERIRDAFYDGYDDVFDTETDKIYGGYKGAFFDKCWAFVTKKHGKDKSVLAKVLGTTRQNIYTIFKERRWRGILLDYLLINHYSDSERELWLPFESELDDAGHVAAIPFVHAQVLNCKTDRRVLSVQDWHYLREALSSDDWKAAEDDERWSDLTEEATLIAEQVYGDCKDAVRLARAKDGIDKVDFWRDATIIAVAHIDTSKTEESDGV